ncbi:MULTISPECIES: AAA family ATPase [Streptacidiphilus]|uniref:AAA family ATPase n=1 Tax=Streptacidiphilus cavernicola TaxID=3342716 RepID=A0ABV6UTA5_9ACTN|nr:LuxR family transcriptional regulator [Streptacidiphilus jeojiense]
MLYGREGEQAAVEALLAGARAGRSGVLVLRGEPGIGKTALLEHAVEAAAPDFRVVRATGVEYEADLPFAGLNLLLSPALDRLPGLPAPQRRALERAFGLSDEPAAPTAAPDRLLAGLATLTLLADLAEKQPLLCVVDDAQWLDHASAGALLLAARRLQAEGVVLLFGARDGEGAWSAPGLPELRLGALPADAARALLAERAAGLSDHARSRVLAQAHGNPLALSELPAAPGPDGPVDGAGAGVEAAGAVPLAGQLQLAYHGQVSRLPAATQTLLLVAAAEETGDLDVILRAAAVLGAAAEDLRAAEQAELVRTAPSEAGQRLVFRHPLLRSAVLQRAPLAQRLAAHRALAEALAALPVPDAEGRRAWHLALAATGPDEPTAAALERAAVQAARRGGHAGAASAYERSARLTPERATATRRYTYAAEAAIEAGETDRAAELAVRTLRRLDPEGSTAGGADGGSDDRLRRAQLLLVQATTQFWRGSDQGAFDLLLRTADLAADVAPEHLARVLMQAFHVAWYLGEEQVGVVCDRLGTLAEPPAAGTVAGAGPDFGPGTHPTAAQAGYLVQVVRSLLGRSTQPVPPVADTVARARAAGAAVPVDLVTVCGATLIMGRDDETLRLAEELVAEARAVGAVGALPTLLFFLAEGELFQGRPAEALAHASEALRIAEDTGQPHWTGQLHSFLAQLAALRGDEASTRRSADAAHAAGLAGRPWTQWSLGLLDLGLGRAEECLGRLEPLVHGPQRHHVAGLRAVPDLVEAAVRLREPERAAGPFDYFRRWAARTGQPWTEALVLRCEALLGEDADAEQRFTAALRRHEEQDRPWDRARTALLYGEWLRRGRRKAEARGPLLAAQSAFDQLGAVPWAERARSELGATGTAAPQGRAGSGPLASLTPQESQIVRLAAQGLSNRDIAAQLFLSSRTVGYHLYKAYPKLGVASRGELAELF